MEYLKRKPLYRPKYPVQALEKALEIIDILAQQDTDEGLGISELNDKLDLGKSTIHRLLDTLVAYQYVERLENNNYRLGWGLFQIGSSIPRQRKIEKIELKALKDLSNKFKETVNLGVRDGSDVIVAAKIDPETNSRLKVDSHVGEREPFNATALGKVLFSELSEEEVRNTLKGMEFRQFTPKTITNIDDYLKEIKKVKEQGYALDDEEFYTGLTCVAMPIRGHEGNIVAALSVSGPSFRFGVDKIETVREELKKVIEEVSKHLGHGIDL